MSKRIGLIFALAALLVNGPRLVITYLAADGLALSAGIEGGILVVTALATGTVLTGGGMFIAHVLGQGHAGTLKGILVVAWLALLGFMVILIAPMMKAGLAYTAFADTLPQRWQWVWSVTAVIAVEVLAGGAMLADALTERETVQPARRDRQSKWSRLSDALVDAAVDRVAPAPATVNGRPEGSHSTGVSATSEQAELAREARELSRDERRRQIRTVTENDPDMSRQALADMFDVSESTIYRDLRAVNGRAG